VGKQVRCPHCRAVFLATAEKSVERSATEATGKLPAFFPPREQRSLLEFVCAEYPFPLAIAYARLHQEMDRQEPVAAAWQLLDAFQSTLRFCACVAVADLFQAEPRGPVSAELAGRLFKPLSFGDWQTLLEDALRPLREPARQGALEKTGRRLPELFTVFYQAKTGQRTDIARQLFAASPNLVSWRNKVFGHGVFRHDRQVYADEVKAWLPRLEELLRALQLVLSGWVLTGQTPGGESVEWTGSGEVSPAAPHAHQPWGEPLPLRLVGRGELVLGPLLTVQQCSVCSQPAAFFLDGVDRRKAGTFQSHFVEYFAGHAVDRKDWSEILHLAERVPAGFEWERAAYDWQEAGKQVTGLFRRFEDEYRRPQYLLDAIWNFVDGHDSGYIHLVGPGGTGKSYLVQGLQQDGQDRGTPVLAYHILAGALSDYRAFVSELADRAREQLRYRTQEIQTRVARHADLAEQLSEFLGELVRANRLSRLIVAIDGLDELRDPEEPQWPLITDFLPPPSRLPPGCFIVLTARPDLRPRVREKLDQLQKAGQSAFCGLSLQPKSDDNRRLISAYLSERLPESLRSPQIVATVFDRAGGVFLYASHLARGLASGAFKNTATLPEGEQFYPAFLNRLREQAGAEDYEHLYLRALLLLSAARAPLLPEQLRRWGLRADRLPQVFEDLADFLRVVKGRRWHESFNDDGDNRYELAHQTFLRFLRTDPALAQKLRQTHADIAAAIQARHQGRWLELDSRDDADLYDLRYLGAHRAESEKGAADRLSAETVRGPFFAEDEGFLKACFNVGGEASERERSLMAIDLFRQAVDGCRRSVQAGRIEVAYGLAAALASLGDALREQGQLAEAVAACREAVDWFRRLVQVGRANADEALASTLNILGAALEDQGQLSDAVTAIREAIAIRRRLVQAGRTELENDLAGAMNSLGNALVVQGQLDEAVASYREALEIRRRLVAAGRTELEDDLAITSNGLGTAVKLRGQLDWAITCFRETIAIRRRLAQAGKTEADSSLAGPLSNLGAALGERGQLGEAVTSLREASRIYQRLVQAGRMELEHNLATCLSNLGNALRVGGHLAEALTPMREAIAICRRLVQAGRAELEIDLARALNNLGLILESKGQLGEATAALREVISLYRKAVQAGRTDLEGELANALTNLGLALRRQGKPAEAVAADREAVAILCRIIEAGRNDLENDLASALTTLGDALADVGQLDESAKVCREAIAIRRRLLFAGRTELAQELALALNNLGVTMREQRKSGEAVPVYREAIDLYRGLIKAGRADLEPGVARSLCNLGLALGDLGQKVESIAAAREALELYRRLVRAGRTDLENELASALFNLGAVLHNSGQLQEAKGLFAEVAQIDEKLVDRGQTHLFPSLIEDYGLEFSLQTQLCEWQSAAATVRALLQRFDALFPDGRIPAAVHQALSQFLSKISRLDNGGRSSLFTALGQDATRIQRWLS
jgi:hypothetical protein